MKLNDKYNKIDKLDINDNIKEEVFNILKE